jgi:hypothetical protein
VPSGQGVNSLGYHPWETYVFFSLIVFPYLHLLTDSYNCVCICVDMCRIQHIGDNMDHITDFAILMGQIAVITLVTIIWRYL